jgi:hypothetical protein
LEAIVTPEGKSPKGNMPEKLIIAHSEYWGRVVISEDMIVNHTMQGRTIEHWVPESALLASEEKVKLAIFAARKIMSIAAEDSMHEDEREIFKTAWELQEALK